MGTATQGMRPLRAALGPRSAGITIRWEAWGRYEDRLLLALPAAQLHEADRRRHGGPQRDLRAREPRPRSPAHLRPPIGRCARVTRRDSGRGMRRLASVSTGAPVPARPLADCEVGHLLPRPPRT